jgi:hypothetical protein
VPTDVPEEGDVPPDGHAGRRDDQGSGSRAARPPGAGAETRDREEYYAGLRTAAKWDENATESRWMWSEYQRKWPSEERAPAHRTPDRAVDSQVEAACDRIADLEKEKISPALRAIETQDPNRHLTGFANRLKDPARLKEKVHGMINELSFSADEAVSHVPDAIRYTFEYKEDRYTQGVWADITRLKDQGFELQKRKNSWSSDDYKGINSQWIEPESGQRFEVQFHTRISFEAKQLTHSAYERLRIKQADKFEELVLEAFQRKVSGDIPIPPGAADIPNYP